MCFIREKNKKISQSVSFNVGVSSAHLYCWYMLTGVPDLLFHTRIRGMAGYIAGRQRGGHVAGKEGLYVGGIM
jgi:hypothetical protein